MRTRFAVLLPLLALPVGAQVRVVECQLPVQPNDPLRYQLRVNDSTPYCEGRYVKLVGAAPLLLASFTSSFIPFDAQSGRPLVVRWDVGGKEDLTLQARALKQHLAFRLDATIPRAKGEFTWPVETIGALELGQPQIGILGWVETVVADAKTSLYFPLSIAQQGSAEERLHHQVTVLPQVKLSSISVRLTKLDAHGSAVASTTRDVKGKEFPARWPQRIDLSELDTETEASVYALELSVTLDDGSPAAFVYHLRIAHR